MRPKFGVLFWPLFLLLPARAQTQTRVTVSGMVNEKGTGSPISGAEVSVIGGEADQEVTDSAGKFSLKFARDVSPGKVVRIRVTKRGYEPQTESIAVSSELSVTFSLKRSTRPKPASNSEGLSPRPQDPISDGDMLFIDCRYGVMPSTYPVSGHLNVLVTSETPGDTLVDYFAPANSQAKWNNTGKPEWAYRCEVTNYTSKVLINVRITVHATFRIPIPSPDSPNSTRQGNVTFDADWALNVPKVDPGPELPFVFWIWNCCVERFVQLRALNSVAVAGLSGDRQISLTQASGNLYQPLLPNGP